MNEHGWKQVCDEVVVESIVGLLDAYEVVASSIPAPESAPRPEIASTIGFTSPQASGTLTLGMPMALVAAAGAANASINAITDWAGELANQALGRFKNRVLSYDVEMGLATPVVVVGAELRIHAGQHVSFAYWFETPSGPLIVHVAAKVDPAFDWVRKQDDEASSLAEGDFMML